MNKTLAIALAVIIIMIFAVGYGIATVIKTGFDMDIFKGEMSVVLLDENGNKVPIAKKDAIIPMDLFYKGHKVRSLEGTITLKLKKEGTGEYTYSIKVWYTVNYDKMHLLTQWTGSTEETTITKKFKADLYDWYQFTTPPNYQEPRILSILGTPKPGVYKITLWAEVLINYHGKQYTARTEALEFEVVYRDDAIFIESFQIVGSPS